MKKATDPVMELARLIATLRGPEGCPWDQKQVLRDLRAYLLEEAHECASAIDSGSFEELKGELGDLLFQVVFVAQLAEEAGEFTLHEAAEGIRDKMIARHPHVFGDEQLTDAQAVREAWERRKVDNRPAETSLLQGVPTSLPALVGAYRMTQKAAAVGFDWPDSQAVLGKVEEELAELVEQVEIDHASDDRTAAIFEELGDLLFTVANLARHLEVDPEAALAAGNRKFRRRFEAIEQSLHEQGKSVNDVDQLELERLWQEIKRTESAGRPGS